MPAPEDSLDQAQSGMAFLDKSTDSDVVIDAIKQALAERREEPGYPL